MNSTNMRKKLKATWKWLRQNIFTKKMILPTLIAETIFWSPVIVTTLLALIVNVRWWTAVGAICVFWAGPLTPAIPLQLALILFVSKLFNHKRKRKDKKQINEQSINEQGD